MRFCCCCCCLCFSLFSSSSFSVLFSPTHSDQLERVPPSWRNALYCARSYNIWTSETTRSVRHDRFLNQKYWSKHKGLPLAPICAYLFDLQFIQLPPLSSPIFSFLTPSRIPVLFIPFLTSRATRTSAAPPRSFLSPPLPSLFPLAFIPCILSSHAPRRCGRSLEALVVFQALQPPRVPGPQQERPRRSGCGGLVLRTYLVPSPDLTRREPDGLLAGARGWYILPLG